MHATRAKFLAAAGAYATVGIVRYPAGAAEFSYKLASVNPLTYAVGARSVEASEKILRDSGGRLEVKVSGPGQLGGTLELLSQLRLSAIELSIPPDGALSTIVPV